MTSRSVAWVVRGNPESAEVEIGGQAAETGNLCAPRWVPPFPAPAPGGQRGLPQPVPKATENSPLPRLSLVGKVPIPFQSSQTPEAVLFLGLG